MRFIFAIVLIISVVACGGISGDPDDNSSLSEDITEENPVNGNLYARGFTITEIDGGHLLSMMDPWNPGEIFARYELKPANYKSNKDEPGLASLSPPFKRWALSSTTHIGFLNALGEEDKVVGCTSPDRIYNEKLSKRYKDGKIAKIGSDMDFNFESVLGIEPDIILQTAFEGQRNKDQRFHSAGLDFVYILEWMEHHPLGRAEWIKVFGLLTGKMVRADSIFNQVKNQYLELKNTTEGLENNPLVMIGNNFNGTWYMPGGQNYMCRFLEDAGFSYPYLESDQRGSLALNFENVLEQFRTADIWLGVSAKGLDDLGREDSRYFLFEPYMNNKVFSVNGRVNDNLGNDFWESGVVYPNLILEDLVSIAHPEIKAGYKLMYYSRLKDEK